MVIHVYRNGLITITSIPSSVPQLRVLVNKVYINAWPARLYLHAVCREYLTRGSTL